MALEVSWKVLVSHAQPGDWVGLFHTETRDCRRYMTTRKIPFPRDWQQRRVLSGAMRFHSPRAVGSYDFRYVRDYEKNGKGGGGRGEVRVLGHERSGWISWVACSRGELSKGQIGGEIASSSLPALHLRSQPAPVRTRCRRAAAVRALPSEI